MARRRMIDPNFWQSEDISRLSVFERLFFIGMFSNADDEGKGRANPNYLRSIIMPYDDISQETVKKAIENISRITSIIIYEVDGNQYYKFENWSKWQRVDKPQKSLIPDPKAPSENDSKNGSKNNSKNGSKNGSRLIPDSFSPKRKEENIKEDIYIYTQAHEELSPKEYICKVLELCKKHCSILYNRHMKKPNADYGLGKVVMEIKDQYSLEELERIIKHASTTYMVKPTYASLDLIWLMNNLEKIKNTPSEQAATKTGSFSPVTTKTTDELLKNLNTLALEDIV